MVIRAESQGPQLPCKTVNTQSKALRIPRHRAFRPGRSLKGASAQTFTSQNSRGVDLATSKLQRDALPREVCLCFCSAWVQLRSPGGVLTPTTGTCAGGLQPPPALWESAPNPEARGRGSSGGPTPPSPLAEAAWGRGLRAAVRDPAAPPQRGYMGSWRKPGA